jgi:dTDP-glucose 4,6-dehydratase
MARELGWTPSHTPEQGLEQTIDWYLANDTWWAPLVAKQAALARRGLTQSP